MANKKVPKITHPHVKRVTKKKEDVASEPVASLIPDPVKAFSSADADINTLAMRLVMSGVFSG